MNAFKGITDLESLFPEQYSEFKTQHYLSVKNVLLEIQVNRSTHPHLSLRLKKRSTATPLLLLCAFMAPYMVNFLFLYLFHIFIL
jgi:hypothetical protein